MFWERFLTECNLIGKKPNPVAKELGVSSGTVTGWKRGSLPKPEVLSKIASYFNVSVDYLMGKTDIKEKPGFPLKCLEGAWIWRLGWKL